MDTDNRIEQKSSVTVIQSAFATAVYPGDGNIALHQNYAPSDGWNCAQVFRGLHWSDVAPEKLLKCAISCLTPEAFRYYLPTYMLARLEHPEKADVAGDYIVLSLVPPEDSTNLRWRKTMEELTGAQKRAVRIFLEAIAEDPEDIIIPEYAKKALDEYWNMASRAGYV